MTAEADAGLRRRTERVGSWLASHPVEIAFALLVTAAFAYSLRITGSYFFFLDDWLLIKQGGSLGGWFQPYSDQMGLIIIGTWRVLAELFGFAFTPFRVVGMVGLYAVPAVYFLTTRRQLGAVVAALLALPLVWYGRYISLIPAQLDHFLVLLGAIGCAAALDRSRRADWVLAGSLTFALCSGGGGGAVVAACLVHNLCTRAPLRRWLAVLVPALAWLVWWLIEVGRASDLRGYAMTWSEVLQFVRDLAYTPFEATALGVGVIAMALVAAFVAYGIWTLSKGLNAGANFLAWSTGFLVWAAGIAINRGHLFASVTTFRYRYVALGLLLLAVVPRRRIVWPARFPIDTDRRFVVAGAVVVLALGSARGLAVHDDIRTSADIQSAGLLATRGETLVIELGPDFVPDHTKLPLAFGWLRAAELRAMFADYGNPFPPGRAAADEQLVDMGNARADPAGTRRVGCDPLTRPFTYKPTEVPRYQYLWSPTEPFTVDVRRFGDRWVRLDEARPGVALRLALPDLGSDTPWRVRAHGACWVGARAP
jgi:hypothetical protein